MTPTPPGPTELQRPPRAAADSREPVPGRGTLLVAIGLALVGTGALLAGVIVLIDRPDLFRALLPATVIGVLAAALSLVPLLWGMRRGPNRAVLGFFVAGGLRAAVVLCGGLLAVYVGGYPLRATLLMAVAFYLAALAAEAAVLGRSLWTMKL